MAEERTQEILCIIQPSFASDQKRKEVIDYLRRLIKRHYATQVLPFGSVPLKTYLPDGDIDLTTLCHQNAEEDLAREFCKILTYEEMDTESEVQDVRYIEAQVKVVKCSVKNISVDISFNQMAGLCALCFLEQVDQLIGKDHLLKQSIILIKAWCFYESRILGAHHGLLSTYALEILVLYIINAFHSLLPGPLAVLFKFLEYYSTFDWDNFCVTINGPIAVSSLPQIVAESPDKNVNELLLSPELLKRCIENFSVPIKAVENGGHGFFIKHLNIVDPLKESNNLGRSVSKGNFHRIKCALSYGAQKLGEIFRYPGENMGEKLEQFFVNTLDRNGKGERPDTVVPVPTFGTGRSEASDLSGEYESYYSGLIQGQWYHNYSLPMSPQMTPPTSPSPTEPRCTWDTLSQLLRCKQKFLSHRGTDVFVPRVPQLHHPYASKVYAPASTMDEMGRSRGTGTYIPNLRQHPYKDYMSRMKVKNSYQRGPSNLPKNTEVECDPEAANGNVSLDEFKSGDGNSENGSCINLSLDHFPLLPCPKKSMESKMNKSSHPILTKDISTSLSIQFGTLSCLPSPLAPPSSLPRNKMESGDPTTSETMTVVPVNGTPKQQESLRTGVGM
ncbi:uncharacterized protein LOC130014588 isoform X1 [Mercurialis annua]|uniref:uncharacterized protein LOC130014588 isoform X1 n=2 Tax=Mercurialis annua TaxID=3986 RepID=UPI00215FA0CE|nr:uncharacterized protein LOC130014588 isoform X1 [Mercurialis annua]